MRIAKIIALLLALLLAFCFGFQSGVASREKQADNGLPVTQ
jgi:hypothetical protein